MSDGKNKNWWLYVLKLEKNKWYVGITSKTPEKRFRQHKNGYMAAAWTKQYKPIGIHYRKDLGYCDLERAQLYEGRVTRKYMEHYGDNNVRGGDLVEAVEYVRRLGFFYTKENWRSVTGVVFLLLVIVFLLLDKFNWDIRVLIALVAAVVIVEVVDRVRIKWKRRDRS